MRRRTQITFATEGGANQSFKKDADINSIMSKYKNTGVIEHMNQRMPQYGDFSSVDDYLQSMNAVLAAQDHFDGLPSHIRDRMANDPANLMRFMSDQDNLEESYELGLREKPPAPKIPPPDGGPTSPEPVVETTTTATPVAGGE